MSNALKAIIGIVFIVVGFEIGGPQLAGFGARLLFSAGASLVFAAAAAQFGPKGPRAPTLSQARRSWFRAVRATTQ